jgi:hypothetical protein
MRRYEGADRGQKCLREDKEGIERIEPEGGKIQLVLLN